MESIKTKKKSKSGKIPKPIKIKKEDDHIMYPMEHYVDDRVELIRQIFFSLKPKTITNLAPDFLKKNKLQDIQEQCLNEILGISKKRLLSIINSTKCPTDTETSSDDDINSIEEHISLEEISSDSDIAEQKGSKPSKDDGKKKQTVKHETDNENSKQFSVLELLELQARARAIRSQLALEPVTKIEVDTDSDEEKAPLVRASSTSETKPSHKKSENITNGRAISNKVDGSKRPVSISTEKEGNEPGSSVPTKRIKLKRNFRKHTRDDDEDHDDEKVTSKPSESLEVKKEEQERSPSPDVIPIIAVPETLCISDSDDEKNVKKSTPKEETTQRSAEITKPVEILSVVNITAPIIMANVTESEDPRTSSTKETPPIEPEEGEIVEDDEKTKETHPREDHPIEDETELKFDEKVAEPEGFKKVINEKEDEPSTFINEENKIPETNDSKSLMVNNSESDDDANDDVISLEGGDLLNEMKEHLEDEIEETRKEDEVICLDDSSEEDTKVEKKSESWNERWLKSSKVSKVLAASRLGNRVRNKIKESKKAKKLEEAAITESEQSKPQEVIFSSKHEDGSIEQYKELLENIQKKTD